MFRGWQQRRLGAGTGLGWLVFVAAACGVDERDFAGGEAGVTAGLGGGAGAGTPAAGGSAVGLGGAPGLAGAAGATSGGAASGAASGVAGAAAGGAGPGAAAGAGGSSPGAAGTGAITSTCSVAQLLVNGGFEAGAEPWVQFTSGTDQLVYDSTQAEYEGVIPHGGQRLGWLGGVPNETNRLSQTVTLPADVLELSFSGALRIQIFEAHALIDFLRITLVTPDRRVPLYEFDNGDATDDWIELGAPIDVAAYAGRAVTLEFESEIGTGPGTNFYLDDLALIPDCGP